MRRYLALVVTVGVTVAGCSSALGGSDVLSEATVTSATPTTAVPADEEQRAIDDLLAALREDTYSGFSKPGVTCIATGLVQRFGVDTAQELSDAFENDDVALPTDDARAAGAIVLGCVDYRTSSRLSFIDSGFSAASADCVFERITDPELELGAVMDFMDEADYDEPMRDLDDKASRLLTECVPEDEMVDLFTTELLADSDLGEQLSLDEASCLSRALLREVGIEGMGELGDGGGTDLRTAELLADAFMGCIDVRAQIAAAMASDGEISPEVAACIVGQIADADLRELLIRSFMRVDGGDLARSLSGQLAQCGHRGGT